MALTLIYGRAGSGKSEYIYNNIASLVSKRKKVYLVVPEQYTHLAERKLLNFLDSISPFSAEVVSFERLCQRINSEFISINSYQIDSAAKNIVISKIIKNTKLDFYTSKNIQTGFVELCSSFISEAKKHNVTVDDIKKESQRTDNIVLKSKLIDIANIYSQYEEHIKNQLDGEDLLDLLYKNIDKSDFFKDSVVFFDEFSSFIPKELDIIAKIIANCDETYMSLCTDSIGQDNSSVFWSVNQTANKVKKICKQNNITLNKPVYIDNNHKYSSSIKHLEQNLYKYSSEFETDDKIKIFYDLNPYYEVKNTAESILSLCRDKGLKLNEIGVVCSNIDEYAKIIKHVFSEYEIKHFIDKKTDILQHNIILFILGILEIYNESYSYKSIFSYLNLGFSSLSDYQISLLENFVLASNIQKTAWINDEKWTYKIGRYSKDNETSKLREKEINSARKLFVKEIYPFHEIIKGRHSAKFFVEEFYKYLLDIKFDKKIDEVIHNFNANSDINKAKEYSLIWDIVMKVFDNIYNLYGDDILSVKEFANILKIAFSQYKTGLIPTSTDEVTIGNIERSIHSDIKALFVLGMSDSEFPVKISEDYLLTNVERELLEKDGMELSDNIISKLYYNKFLCYKCLTTPSEYLFLSFPVSNFDNRPLRPSFVLTCVKRIFKGLDEETRLGDNKNGIELISSKKPTVEQMIEEMNNDDYDKIWDDVLLYCSNDNDNTLKHIKDISLFNPDAKKLSKNLTSEFFEENIHTSISKLQRYRECKFSYFMQYMLKLEEKEIFSITPADIGSLVHKIFEDICKEISDKKISFANVDKSYYEELIEKYIDDYIEKLSLVNISLSKRQIYLVKRLKNTVKLCFEALLGHIANSKFEPMGYEIYFGDDGIGSVDIKTNAGKTFKIEGVIDRADSFEGENGTYVRIVDYKTGKKTFSFSDVFYGLDVQLIVYLNALVKSDSKYKYGGALYFKIDDCIFKADNKYAENLTDSKIKNMLKLKGVIVSDDVIVDAYDETTKIRANTATYDQLEKLSENVFKTINLLCEDLINGDISIKPYKKGTKMPCSYCVYKDICKFSMGCSDYEDIISLKKDEVFDRLEGVNNVDK